MMKNKIKQMIYSVLFKLILILDYIIPKNKKQFLFASNGRKLFSGNAKKLYMDFKNSDNFKVSFTQNMPLEDSYYINLKTIQGIIYFIRTKYLIGTHGGGDFLYPFSSRKIFIQTWHGSPLKKMGLCDANRSKNSIKTLNHETRKIDYLLSSSEMVTSSLIRCFGICETKILNIGYPKNDFLIDYQKNYTLLKKYKKTKLILYAPTFRDWEDIKLFPFKDIDFLALDKMLEKNDAVILLRSHINNKDKNIIKGKNIIDFGFEECADVNDILGEIDILITDYSSIYFDFLLLDKPTIFIPYDLEIYRKKRGFLYDGYSEIMIGDKISTQEELISSINFNLGNDLHKLERARINTLFNSSQSSDTFKKLVKELNL